MQVKYERGKIMWEIMMGMTQVIQADDPEISVTWVIEEDVSGAQINVRYYDQDNQFVAGFIIDVDKINGRVTAGKVETVGNQPNPTLFTPIAARFQELIAGTSISLALDLTALEEQSYRLYVWHDVLEDYTAGVIFAIARSIEEARQTVITNALQDSDYAVKRLEEEMTTEPEIYDGPVGFFLYGGS